MLNLATSPILCFIGFTAALAIEPNPAATRPTADYVPDVAALATPASSELRELVERFTTDQRELERFYSVPGSAVCAERMGSFYRTWQSRLADVDFEKLGVEGRIDATLLRSQLTYELRLLDRQSARTREIAALVPFADAVTHLQEARRLLEPVDAKAAAATLSQMKESLGKARAALEAGLRPGTKEEGKSGKDKAAPLQVTKVVALRAERRVRELQRSIEEWFKTFDGYDPAFGWWTREPYKQFASALDDYGKFLHEKVAGIDPRPRRSRSSAIPSAATHCWRIWKTR